MHLWKIKLGKRTFRLTFASFILGLILFFNSSTISSLLESSLFLALSIGILTTVTENFDSWPKIIAAWFILIFVPLIWFFMTTSSLCSLGAENEYDIARNPLKGEIVQRYNPSMCDTISFPWYYEELNKSEKQNYCELNPDTEFCKRCESGLIMRRESVCP